jgi:hypothetical protein
MANTIKPDSLRKQAKSARRDLRALPTWEVVRLYRRAGVTQWDIASEAKCSQGTVTKAIYKRGAGPAIERVWAILERVIGPHPKEI